MPAVSDSSPLILLAAIGRLDLLRRLYGEVVVPPAVWREVFGGRSRRTGAIEVPRPGWIRRQPLQEDGTPPDFLAGLDRGEAEAIALVMTLPRSVPIILDDLPARRTTDRLGLSVTRTGGVLVLAKQEGFVPEFRPLLRDLRVAGLYLSAAAVDRFLDLAGER